MIKTTRFKKLALAGAVSTMLLVSNMANAHLTYNSTGNGGATSPIDGSLGFDGYTGNLPATWMSAIHNGTGLPKSQTASSAGAGFTLGMGAKAYKDGATNWGETSDFGLIELARGANVTITVASDNSDLRPAFGLWKGWDTSLSCITDPLHCASRHGTYTSNGAINPMAAGVLGSTLTLVDPDAWAVAPTQGPTAVATLTRFLAAGEYTVILGGYDGTTDGANLAYKATISAAASPVPLPAAIWMFGGVMMGWLGIQKRKMAA